MPAFDLLLADLRALVEAESPSSDPSALAGCARRLAELLAARLGNEPTIGEDSRVTWSSEGAGAPASRPVLLLGHLDTVWPLGTIGRLPFAVHDDGRVTGPGVFDMKAGLAVLVHALARLRGRAELPPVRLLVTTDEETGSRRSRAQIEVEARRCGRVLVAEPCGPGGAVKTARKGVAMACLRVHGRASHAGLAPEQGVNAAVILGGLLPRVATLSDPATGTTVTPTVLSAGTAVNTVPALAEAHLDIRFLEAAEVGRVRSALEALPAGGGRLEVTVEVNRPAMPPSASEPLLPALRAAAGAAGVAVSTVTVGGASDGNLAAAVGAAVLDGLGPEGDGAHADHEHVTLDGLQRRLDLLTALIPRVAQVPAGVGPG